MIKTSNSLSDWSSVAFFDCLPCGRQFVSLAQVFYQYLSSSLTMTVCSFVKWMDCRGSLRLIWYYHFIVVSFFLLIALVSIPGGFLPSAPLFSNYMWLYCCSTSSGPIRCRFLLVPPFFVQLYVEFFLVAVPLLVQLHVALLLLSLSWTN